MNRLFFDQKVIVITGSSKGIGKGLAFFLGSCHAKIVLNARNSDQLSSTENEMKKRGYDVISFRGDISKEEDCINLINTAVNHYGKIDVLVNNAGVSMRGSFSDLSTKLIIDSFNLNAIAPLILTKIALPYIKQSDGSIIFISTLAGLYGLPNISVYSASKMPLTAITQALRVEHNSDRIHFGLIYVGITENEPGKTVLNTEGNPVSLREEGRPFQSSLESVVSKISSVISSRKKQLVIGMPGKTFYILSRYFPRILKFLLIRQKNKIERIYR